MSDTNQVHKNKIIREHSPLKIISEPGESSSARTRSDTLGPLSSLSVADDDGRARRCIPRIGSLLSAPIILRCAASRSIEFLLKRGVAEPSRFQKEQLIATKGAEEVLGVYTFRWRCGRSGRILGWPPPAATLPLPTWALLLGGV
jgi:hypothetical protein